MEHAIGELPWEAVGLAIGTLLAGFINALAGGGTLLTFPALIAFTSGVGANCTSTLALLPAAMSSSLAYRKELSEDRAWLTWLAPISLVGATIGGLLVILPSPEHFDRIVPFLALTASVLFALQPLLAPRIAMAESASRKPPLWVLFSQFLIAVYGAYFGAGIGIMMLALLGLLPLGGIQRANALKILLAGLINLVASVIFLVGPYLFRVEAAIRWDLLALMVPLAILGGYMGGFFGRKIPKLYLRIFVLIVGFGQTIWFFLRMG